MSSFIFLLFQFSEQAKVEVDPNEEGKFLTKKKSEKKLRGKAKISFI